MAKILEQSSNEEQSDSVLRPWSIFLSGQALALLILSIFFYCLNYLEELSTPVFASSVLLVLMTTSLAAAPLIRFVMIGWKARRHEFLNRLNRNALTAYLQQFWEKRITGDKENFVGWTPKEAINEIKKHATDAIDAMSKLDSSAKDQAKKNISNAIVAIQYLDKDVKDTVEKHVANEIDTISALDQATKDKTKKNLEEIVDTIPNLEQILENHISIKMSETFDAIYGEQYGRTAFFVPTLLLISIIFISTVLSVLFYLDFKKVIHIEILDISAKIAIASMAGAYLYVVSNTIQSVRQRCLNTSDIYWYVLRMLLAVPIGFALTSPTINASFDTGIRPFVAFGLGTLPMDQILSVLRQATSKLLSLSETVEKSDHLNQLEGVTNRVASILNAEGVDSIEQIITVDPVLLSIRTGLPFKFILQLGSQAIVRRYLGATAERLIPLSLANAESISTLVTNLDSTNQTIKDGAVAILNVATLQIQSEKVVTPSTGDSVELAVNIDSDITKEDLTKCLEFNFRQIADANYTKFILGKLLKMDY